MPALIRVVRCGQTEGYMAGEASEKVLPGELWGGPDDRFAPAGSSRGGPFAGPRQCSGCRRFASGAEAFPRGVRGEKERKPWLAWTTSLSALWGSRLASFELFMSYSPRRRELDDTSASWRGPANQDRGARQTPTAGRSRLSPPRRVFAF